MPKKRSQVIFSLLLALVAGSPALAEGIWASFRGPHGTGEAADLPPGDGPLALELAWKRPLGRGYSGISIANNTLITAGAYGDRDYVVALDPATDEERWRGSGKARHEVPYQSLEPLPMHQLGQVAEARGEVRLGAGKVLAYCPETGPTDAGVGDCRVDRLHSGAAIAAKPCCPDSRLTGEVGVDEYSATDIRVMSDLGCTVVVRKR